MGVVEVREEVLGHLRTAVDGVTELDDGGIIYPAGSTRVFIDVVDWHALGSPMAVVRISAIAVFDIPGSPDLFEQIATKAADNLFATISLSKVGDNLYNVGVTHSLLGSSFTPEALGTATESVTSVTELIVEWLIERYGGKRWADLHPSDG